MNSLVLTNFRIHKHLKLSWTKDYTLILGPNGSGKTTILEALFLLSTTKSFRTNDDLEMISDKEPFCKISFDFEDNIYEIVISKEGKRVFINNTECQKYSDYYGKFNAIIFSAIDPLYINGSPGDKRKLFDMFFGQLDIEYLKTNAEYKNIIKDKNQLLKEKTVNLVLLDSFNDLICKYSEYINTKRKHYIDLLNQELTPKYKIKYLPNININDLKEILQNNQEKEILMQLSLYGAHKDDYLFYIDNQEASIYASSGNARMLMIDLKFAFLSLIKKITKKSVILLLDDIFSELDKNNIDLIIKRIPKEDHVFITSPKAITLPKGYQKIILKKQGVKYEQKQI